MAGLLETMKRALPNPDWMRVRGLRDCAVRSAVLC